MKQKEYNEKQAAYRSILKIALVIALLNLMAVWLISIWNKIPSNIYIQSGTKQEINFQIPATGKISHFVPTMAGENQRIEEASVNMADTITFYAADRNQYQMDIRLFGLIPFKTTEVSVIENRKVIPVGEPIGIYVKTDGILILDIGEFMGSDGEMKAPSKQLLRPGDYILSYNGEPIEEKEVLMDKISESDGKSVILTIQREKEIFDLCLEPQKNEKDEYKLGIWIRDNAQGVGTLTFIDSNHQFGALGHGINDVDTEALMHLESGSLYKTDIIAIKKGKKGIPGELTGLIAYSDENKIGEINQNSNNGIFGKLTSEYFASEHGEYYDIALKQEIEIGPAQMLCCVDNETKLYDIMIEAVHLSQDNVNRGIEIRVTDSLLLEKTGGIVQGMSGSPIIQNNRLIGAVTHVLVNDNTRGYGIFIEEMLEKTENKK